MALSTISRQVQLSPYLYFLYWIEMNYVSLRQFIWFFIFFLNCSSPQFLLRCGLEKLELVYVPEFCSQLHFKCSCFISEAISQVHLPLRFCFFIWYLSRRLARIKFVFCPHFCDGKSFNNLGLRYPDLRKFPIHMQCAMCILSLQRIEFCFFLIMSVILLSHCLKLWLLGIYYNCYNNVGFDRHHSIRTLNNSLEANPRQHKCFACPRMTLSS